jgi:glutathione S-transferase
MPPAHEELARPTIIGRSSSHFTRVTRVFAAEVKVDCALQVVRDLTSTDPADYAGNPALKVPVLRTSRGVWFGALQICRELWRLSGREGRVVWPEDLDQPLLSNAQELVVHAMGTEVSLIMAKVSGQVGGAHQDKVRKSLINVMAWLEENAAQILAALPRERDVSFLEIGLFCLVTHLEWREVLSTAPYSRLNDFCRDFGARPSAQETGYRFDQ